MNHFVYKTLPDSGLGDRLLDLINVYVYSEVLGYNKFYVEWKYGPQFDKSRKCLKQENLFHYMCFPENIIFTSKEEMNKIKDGFIFDNIVGAQSLYSFMEKYVEEKYKSTYEKLYYDVCKRFKMKNIPEEVVNIFTNNNISTVHLRRTDKITNNKGCFGVDLNELENLNNITKEFINKELQIGNRICIVSDDEKEKNNFLLNYKYSNILSFNLHDQVLQAYVDFYSLMYSKKIFLSQQFSTFSIVASLLNEPSQLYYPYDWGRIPDYQFNKYENLYYFKIEPIYINELNMIQQNMFHNKKVHMITYGDDRFYNAKKALITEAKESNFFYSIKGYSKNDLSKEFLEENAEILGHSRGGGYFVWRGHVIRKKLDELNEGDFLIFNDAGNTFNKNGENKLLEYLTNLNNSPYGLLLFKTTYNERNWTTKEIFNYFNVDINSNIAIEGQHWVGSLIIQKNNHSILLFDKYLETLKKKPLLFSDYYNNIEQHSFFVENRHDQSILSIISKIHGCVSIPPPVNMHDEAFECSVPKVYLPIWCTHRRDGINNSSYVENYDGGILHKKK